MSHDVTSELFSQVEAMSENKGINSALEFALLNYKNDHDLIILIAVFYNSKQEWSEVFYWSKKAISYNIDYSPAIFYFLSREYYSQYVHKGKKEQDLQKSLKSAKKYSNCTFSDERDSVTANFNVGFLYFILNEYKRALVYFKKAMKQGHVYSEMYFIAIMFDLESMPINPLKLLCLAFRIRIKKQILMWRDKEDMRLDKGFLNGNQILGDESILSGWMRRFKNRKGTSKVNLR
ncbi:SEL1-like repeat protein [Thiomicrorhabdus arctica]|uniref:hypothetical protein n=1 Tax=Thiomicrorhabdus arctica TaxID=131540 RepID=UPI000370C555|nr:hypothetical protein [Thiomicrorhabdus arctica]